jgi:hypothetical protein
MFVFLKTNAQMLPDVKGRNRRLLVQNFQSRSSPSVVTDSWEGAHDDGAGCVHSIEVLRVLLLDTVQNERRIVVFANKRMD